MSAIELPAITASAPPRRSGRGLPGLRGTGVAAHISAFVLAVAAFVALFGERLAPHDPDLSNLSYSYVGPIAGHPLGFDSQGRDLFSRVLAGARSSLLGPTIVVLLAMLVGVLLAVASAWKGGRFDTFVSAALDVLFAFPAIVLAILVSVIIEPGLKSATIALSIAYTPYIARVLRSAALRERARDYIAALEVQGIRATVICVKHLGRNLLPLIVAQGAVLFGYAMVDLAAISFLGLGVQTPQADWGVMVSEGKTSLLQGYPLVSIAAVLCIVAVVAAVSFLGDRLDTSSKAVNR